MHREVTYNHAVAVDQHHSDLIIILTRKCQLQFV